MKYFLFWTRFDVSTTNSTSAGLRPGICVQMSSPLQILNKEFSFYVRASPSWIRIVVWWNTSHRASPGLYGPKRPVRSLRPSLMSHIYKYFYYLVWFTLRMSPVRAHSTWYSCYHTPICSTIVPIRHNCFTYWCESSLTRGYTSPSGSYIPSFAPPSPVQSPRDITVGRFAPHFNVPGGCRGAEPPY